MLKRQEKRKRRHKRVRAKIFGTAKTPRLCVFKSAKHIYAQIIDDEKNMIIASSDDRKLKNKKDSKEKEKMKKVDFAFEVGKLIAKKALEKKIKKVVFDRNGYKYHGRIRSLAEGAREGGLEF